MICSDSMSGSYFIVQTSKFLLIDAIAVTLGQGNELKTSSDLGHCCKCSVFECINFTIWVKKEALFVIYMLSSNDKQRRIL